MLAGTAVAYGHVLDVGFRRFCPKSCQSGHDNLVATLLRAQFQNKWCPIGASKCVKRLNKVNRAHLFQILKNPNS